MIASGRPTWLTLTEEALRLFFPLAALHGALWPLMWTWLFALDLPGRSALPATLWHAHEMTFGTFGAALLGFILTAVPEWTGTRRAGPCLILVLAGAWALARFAGFIGADWANPVAAIADIAWLAALVGFVLRAGLRARTTALGGFAVWLGAMLISEAVFRAGIVTHDADLAGGALWIALLAFAALLSLALARIAPAITNRILDPSRVTAPFRPHPGRRHLAAGLLAGLLAAELAGASAAVTGYLAIAAGAAFFDRVSESFIGKAFFRLEILALAGSAAFAGAGLVLIGCGRLGAGGLEIAGVHVLSMGGLGIAVLGVFSIAGKLHTGQELGLSPWMWAAFALLMSAVLLRALPAIGVVPPGPAHGLASIAWASAFLIWIRLYWPAFSKPSEFFGESSGVNQSDPTDTVC